MRYSIVSLNLNRILFFSLALLTGLLPTVTSANTAVTTADQSTVILTTQEKAWLNEHPVIRLGNSVDWPPFGFSNNKGAYSGIAADYIKAIEKLLGIKIEAAQLESWRATIEAARSGKVDMLDAVVPTSQRKKFLVFTKPYLSYPVVIFAQSHVPYIEDISELNGQQVTVIAGSALHELLINNHPGIEIQPVKNAKTGLISVESKKAIAFIGNLPTASRVIALEGITNLKVAGETPYRYDLSIGINKDKPILASILQKALDSISEVNKNEIHRKWMNVTFEHKVDYSRIILLLGIIIFIFISIHFWSRHRQVIQLKQEVEKRKTVEETLRDKEARVSAIFETVVDGIITITEDGIIESFNPAAELMFGYNANDIVGQNVNILMPASHQKKHNGYINNYIQTGETRVIGAGRELEAKRSDGSVFSIELSVSEMWIDKQRKFTGVIRDISERKRAEIELKTHKENLEKLVQQRTSELSATNILLAKAKEQAESASHSKSTFLAHMSHELRTPLNVILGYAYMLQNDPEIHDSQQKKIKSIEKSGEYLLTQISDILDIAKIEANKVELNPTTINIRRYIDYICSYFSMSAETKNIKLTCTVDDSVNLAIYIDEKRLQQILINLIANAIKFTETGTVFVKLEPCEPVIPISEKESCLRFSVEDTGIGIAKEDTEQIFQPFIQLNKDNHNGRGTGLGLNIAKQLVKLMNSELKVESEINKGSRFWFDIILPDTEEKEIKEPYLTKAETPTGYHGRKRKILAVDDIKDVREVTRDMLTKLGFQVTVVSKGLDSVIIAKDMQPDLILMDLLMPELNGYESLTILRNIPECKNIPVVAMSASVSEEESALLAGFDYFLPKPVTLKHFISMFVEILKLEWVYKPAKLEAEQPALTPPPLVELEKLRDWAQLGKMKRIVEWADIQLSEPSEYRYFALQIHDLAREIKDTQILALLDDY